MSDVLENQKNDSVKQAIRDALILQIGDSFDCTRTWSAWSAGTMREDDFNAVLDRIDDITEEVAKAVSDALASGEGTR